VSRKRFSTVLEMISMLCKANSHCFARYRFGFDLKGWIYELDHIMIF